MDIKITEGKSAKLICRRNADVKKTVDKFAEVHGLTE